MFRSNKDEFGLYVYKHGDSSRHIDTAEWEGTAEQVAWHIRLTLLFDSRFIGIRHFETGRRPNYLRKRHAMHLRWPRHEQFSSRAWDVIVSQEPRVRGVTNMDLAPQPGRREVTTQHMFKLVPMVLLSCLGRWICFRTRRTLISRIRHCIRPN